MQNKYALLGLLTHYSKFELHFDLMWEYKNPSWLYGVDRKLCPKGHFRQKWCQTVIPKDRVFYPHQTVMVDSFPSTPFQFLLLFVISNAKHSPTF